MAMSGGFGQPPQARIYTDERTRKYEAQLRYAAQQIMDGRPPIAEPVVVTIEARFQIPVSFSKRKRVEARMGLIFPMVKPDWDNFAKSCDALNGVVWVDDKQVVDGRIVKIYAEQPGLSIIVETKFSGQLQPALPSVNPPNQSRVSAEPRRQRSLLTTP
jgi:Holliday junction resolvase RusA-like endonuclease